MVDETSQHDETDKEAPRTEYGEHEATYGAFLGLMKRAVIIVVLVLIGMAIFLT